MASVVPALPLLSKSLQADYATVQFVVSAYLLGLGLFQPVQGLLSDRFGRRPVLLAGYGVFLVASLAAHRTGSADPDEPVGFLTHHLAHDDDAWRFTEAALARLAAHRAVRFSDPRTLFA